MSVLNNSNAIETGGYNIQRSLRFRSSASANLRRTFTTPTNSKICTISDWVKRGRLGYANPRLLDANNGGASKGSNFNYYFNSSDKLEIGDYNNVILTSNAVYRDPSAWYHIVLAIDTTQATATNRLRVYVNGAEISYTQGPSFPTQNEQLCVNTACAHGIGSNAAGTADYFDGYLAEVNFIDGQALTPSSFGEFSAETGVWVPKKYTGTYGTNGFYLDFKDNTSATTLAYDKSGNGNNWTPNNISTTAGATYDSMTDVPTLTSTTAANYCVLNAVYPSSYKTESNGNLTATGNTATNSGLSVASFGVSSGKWSWEVTLGSRVSNDPSIGLTAQVPSNGNGQSIGDMNPSVFYRANGDIYKNTSLVTSTTALVSNDVLRFELDLDALTCAIYLNNTLKQTVTSLTAGTYFPCATVYNGGYVNFNFGQRAFANTPSTGFKALNTFNLPDPVIKKPNQYMDATTYTGTGAAQTITNAGGFAPDLVWAKNRSISANHVLVDTSRGAPAYLNSNTTNAEGNSSTVVSAFTSTGFTLGNDGTINGNGNAIVGWQWKAGGTAVVNSQGSITSQVSANPTAGFSVVTYTGNGTAGATVGHGLGVAPKLVIAKWRTGGTAQGWPVYHASTGNTQYLALNATDAAAANSTLWNNTSPTSTTFSIGTNTWVNGNGWTYVAYCFSEIAGYSKFGSFTGNGSADGPFVYCGFRPKYVMIKVASGTSDSWTINDAARNTYNVTDSILYPNLSDAEGVGSGAYIDFTSNGFKIRNNNSRNNGSGYTYIFAAFAENPFKYSNAR